MIDFPVSTDVAYLIARLLFVGLIYLFIWQVLRVTLADLRAIAAKPAPRRRQGRGSLVVVEPAESGLSPGTAFALKAKTSIGRHADCTIAIDEPFLSAFHAEVAARDGTWQVTDLDSTNGTFVEGSQVIGETDIWPGDVVQFGRIKMQLVT
jgi:pSer/pThr/pTyr-binding forkhead associated (FHA) protein